jgi:hypothetical protein
MYHIVEYCLKTRQFEDYNIVFMEIFLHEKVRSVVIVRLRTKATK